MLSERKILQLHNYKLVIRLHGGARSERNWPAIQVPLIKNGCGQIVISVSASRIRFVCKLIYFLAAIKLQKVPVDHQENAVAFNLNETEIKADKRWARISLPIKAYEGKGTVGFHEHH